MKGTQPLTLVLGLVFLLGGAANTFAGGKYLYIQSNNVAEGQNTVIAYERHKDGALTPHPAGPFMTGGTGINNSTNGKLGPNDNDTPIIVSPDNKRQWLCTFHSDLLRRR